VVCYFTNRRFDVHCPSLRSQSYLDSEDEVRVVKSQKDRKWDSIQEGIVRIRNARKNSDWPLIQDEFANVNKMIEKSKMLILQSGLPPFYVKMLMEVEDHVQLALKDKDAIKKMKPVVSRALNQMKLQVRKHNENYKEGIADCRANPDKYVEVEEEESSSSSESDSDSDSDDSDSDSDSDASSESEKPTPKAKPAAKPVAKKVNTRRSFVEVYCWGHLSRAMINKYIPRFRDSNDTPRNGSPSGSMRQIISRK